MIGAFARRLDARSQVLTPEEASEQAPNALPESFVQRIPHEGGDIVFAPLIEALRSVLRKPATVPGLSQKPQTPPDSPDVA